MADIFEKELGKDSVFKDKDVLSPHYLPQNLPHREKEIEKIMKIIAPALKGQRTQNLFLYGKTGVGKSASVKHVLNNMDEVMEKYKARVMWAMINCVKANSKYQVVLSIAEKCHPEENFSGHSFTTLVDKVARHIEKNGFSMVIVLDEIDKVKTELDELAYTLTRMNDDISNGGITIIGISNKATFKEALDPRSKSSLCEEELVFKPYNAEELEDILKDRSREGFRKGCVDASAMAIASALAAQESGDARYALKLLIKAGEICDERGDQKVTDEHVKRARKAAEEEIVYEIISTLPEHQKIVLYSVAMLTKEMGAQKQLAGERKDKVLFSGEIYEKYRKVCAEMRRKPRSARWCKEYINDLEMLGLLTKTLSGKGVRGTTTLVKLEFPAKNIEAILEKQLR